MVSASRTIATWPFQKIRSPRCRCLVSAALERPAEAVLLHVAVARAAGAGGVERNLHEAGAIDAKAALAAPQIGRADEVFGDRDEITLDSIDAADMPARQVPAFAGDRESAVLARHAHPCSDRQRIDRRQFDRRPGKREGPQRGDLVRRRGDRFCQRGIGKPADIAVAVQLAPGKAFAVAVVDRHALAFQRLRQQLPRRWTAPRAAARARRKFRIPRRSRSAPP